MYLFHPFYNQDRMDVLSGAGARHFAAGAKQGARVRDEDALLDVVSS